MSDYKYSIQAKNVNKVFYKKSKKVYALIDFNLKIEKGTIHGLLGPNGAGKSTFINILGGLVNKNSGEINICGIDIDKKDFIIENVSILQGDQSDKLFLESIIKKYEKFDIIIDDGSHQAKHIIASFNFLFSHLNDKGIYVIEDLQTSYLPRYGGSRLNLNKRNSSMNFIKSLTDSINYEQNDKPFFKKKTFDGKIKSIYFYQNIAFINKGESINYFYNHKKEQ